MSQKSETAIFAAGCFWGVQYYFDQVPGVVATTAGYTGGHVPNPTYELVCSQTTGHVEAVKIEFDPARVSFTTLLRHFFRLHDPTQLNRQGPDIGNQYRSAVFYTAKAQKKQTEEMIRHLKAAKRFPKPIVTEVAKASDFYPAEEYHQKFTVKTGRGMCHVDYVPM